MTPKDIRPNKNGIFPKLEPGLHGVAIGNGSRFDIGIIHSDGDIFVAIERHGAYRFGHHVHPSYVWQKLNVIEGDAENIADLINDQLGCGVVGRYGKYYPEMTAK